MKAACILAMATTVVLARAGSGAQAGDPAAAGTWAFPPKRDTYEAGALLDLRGLNEKVAGEHGFVKLAADGESFVRGDGLPLRFWAAGERTRDDMTMSKLEDQAQFLAKRGVNCLRIFAMLPPTEAKAEITSVNEKELDITFRVVAAMKKAGIYTIIDGFWPGATKVQAGWDLGPGIQSLENLEYTHPKVQEAFKAWMKALMTRPNPYTQVALKDEPAVAVLQLQNEDSLLWWSFGKDLPRLRERYAEFLAQKYGSVDKARERWKGCTPDKGMPDDPQTGHPGFVMTWGWTRDGTAQFGATPGFKERSADQLEFATRLMRRFNDEMALYLRKELGCRQLINANNWRTVDLTTTQDAQYWADSGSEVLARNVYVGGLHTGKDAGWRIVKGQRYTDKSLLRSPEEWPMNVRVPAGRVFILPEVLWCPPNLYQAEAVFVMAGQQSLTRLGAGCWFSNFVDNWDDEGVPGAKWNYSTPMQIGQFPAAALMVRKGYLKAGVPAIVEHRSLQDLWDRKTPLVSEDPGWDPNRDIGNRPLTSSIKTALDPLAYLVGPVRVVFESDAAKSTVVELGKYIDREKKVVRSITGEIETDYGVGLYRINAPKAQAVAGFLRAGGVQKLADVEIDAKNEYGAVAVVAMDDRPIRESGRVLVQMGTLARPTGWQTTATVITQDKRTVDGKLIESTGKLPWQVERLDATLVVGNPRLKQATVLDANGMAEAKEVAVRREGGKAVMTLPAEALYMILSGE